MLSGASFSGRRIMGALIVGVCINALRGGVPSRSEEHTSELQSRPHLVCRLLLEKEKNNQWTFKSSGTYKKSIKVTAASVVTKNPMSSTRRICSTTRGTD